MQQAPPPPTPPAAPVVRLPSRAARGESAGRADGSSSSPPSMPPRPASPRRWFQLSPSTGLGLTGVLSLAIVALGAAWLIASPVPSDLPDQSSLGVASSRRWICPRDLVMPDPDATAALQAEALAAVRPVYDLDIGRGAELQSRVAQAFAYARGAVDAHSAPSVTLSGLTARLQTPVDDTTFRAVAQLEFGTALEQEVAQRLGEVFAQEIAPHRSFVVSERGDGITIRPGGAAGQQPERDVRDTDRIPDVTQVRSELLRQAAAAADVAEDAPAPSPAPKGASTEDAARAEVPPPVPAPIRSAAALLVAQLVVPNLTYNAIESESRRREALQSVRPVVVNYRRGDLIVDEGDRIEPRHLRVFTRIREQARVLDAAWLRGGAASYAVLLSIAAFALARRTVRKFRPTKRDLLFLSLALVGNLAITRGAALLLDAVRLRWIDLEPQTLAYVLPIATGTMLVRLVRAGESSVVFALVSFPLAGLQNGTFGTTLAGLVGALMAADLVARRPGARGLWGAAVASGLGAGAAAVAIGLQSALPWTTILHQGLAAAVGSGLVSPVLALGLAAVAESALGYTSEARLAQLASLHHPILKELIIRAPGTYHHSLLVGNLAEAAAEAVGAHPILARIGGWYHDIGKAETPLLHPENRRGAGTEGVGERLDALDPATEVEVARTHIVAGLSRADLDHLPRVVRDMIRQHHGTRVIRRAYERAVELARRTGQPDPNVDAFRHAGPVPRSREAGLVLLANAVESAARALPEPARTPDRLRQLVGQVVEPLVLDGQLDDSDLTLADLRRATAALGDALCTLYRRPPAEVIPAPRPMVD